MKQANFLMPPIFPSNVKNKKINGMMSRKKHEKVPDKGNK
jgi:hypothetical protein